VDDAKHATGVDTCRNFVIKPHGPAENRAGFAMVREVKTSAKRTRVIPFVFASDQTVVIEIGEGYFRFHTQGATVSPGSPSAWSGATTYAVGDLVSLSGVNYYCKAAHTNQSPPSASYWHTMPTGIYEIPNGYSAADIPSLKFVQANDIITFTHASYDVAELKRYSSIRWIFASVSFVPTLTAPTGTKATATPAVTTPGTPTLQSYVITSVANKEESIASSDALTGSVTLSAVSNANPGVFTAADTYYGSASSTFSVDDVVFVDGVGGMASLNGKFYKVRTVSYTPGFAFPFGGYYPGATTFTLKDVSSGAQLDTSGFGAYSGGGTVQRVGAARCSNNLFDDAAYNTISWNAVAGATRYNVYKLSNGLYGYIGQTENVSFTDDSIAPDLSKTPPIYDTPLSGTDNRPSSVGYFEQRRCFAGTNAKPSNFWATRSGTETNLSYSIPGRDDDSIRFKIAARERNTIRHIVPMNNLILLTESAEWRVAATTGEALTPDVSLRAQSFIGASEAQPVVVNNNLIFAAARGGHLRELAYDWQASGYITGDLSLRAPHLFDRYAITEIAYAKAPIPIVWAVSSSGALLGFTYVPEQQVGAWHRHDTYNGTFESVAIVAEGSEDVLYAVVNRTINGAQKRFVERMASRFVVTPNDGFFVDCGKTYSGAPATVISGLDHLNGENVAVLSDGNYIGTLLVADGTITLPDAASVVHAGLPITADLKTLPLAFEAIGFGQGRPKNVNKTWLRVYLSRNIKAGPTFDDLTEVAQRDVEPAGTVLELDTGEYEVALAPQWNDSGQVCIRQDLPLPLTVLAITTEFVAGG